MKFCHQCGSPLREGARFCTTCGTPVGVATAPPPAAMPPVPMPPVPMPPVPVPPVVMAPVAVAPLAAPPTFVVPGPPPPRPGSPSLPPRQTNGAIVTLLAVAGFVVGLLLVRYVVQDFLFDLYWDEFYGSDNPVADLIFGCYVWIVRALPLLVAGLAVLPYVRPRGLSALLAGIVLLASVLPYLVVALLDSEWLGFGGGWVQEIALVAFLVAAATSAWLLLRGRPGLRHLFTLAAVGLSVLVVVLMRVSATGGQVHRIYEDLPVLHGMVSINYLLWMAPVIVGAWLGAIPRRPAQFGYPVPGGQPGRIGP